MHAPALIARLGAFPPALDALLARLPDADWRRRPAEGGWSILEVAVHLLDEEIDDFRPRVRLMVEDPTRAWTPIDPEGAVVARRCNERDPAEVLRRFAEERAASLAWLRGLSNPRWENSSVRPDGHVLRAGDVMASWPAHDARHLQQIAKRLHWLAAEDGKPYDVGYAG